MKEQAHSLPPFVYRYFWDIDPSTLDVTQYPVYVIERLLEHGDLAAVRWLLQHFSREQLISAVQHSRRLSPLSANFWALYLGLDKEGVACLSRHFREGVATAWPY